MKSCQQHRISSIAMDTEMFDCGIRFTQVQLHDLGNKVAALVLNTPAQVKVSF